MPSFPPVFTLLYMYTRCCFDGKTWLLSWWDEENFSSPVLSWSTSLFNLSAITEWLSDKVMVWILSTRLYFSSSLTTLTWTEKGQKNIPGAGVSSSQTIWDNVLLAHDRGCNHQLLDSGIIPKKSVKCNACLADGATWKAMVIIKKCSLCMWPWLFSLNCKAIYLLSYDISVNM